MQNFLKEQEFPIASNISSSIFINHYGCFNMFTNSVILFFQQMKLNSPFFNCCLNVLTPFIIHYQSMERKAVLQQRNLEVTTLTKRQEVNIIRLHCYHVSLIQRHFLKIMTLIYLHETRQTQNEGHSTNADHYYIKPSRSSQIRNTRERLTTKRTVKK